MEIHSLTLSSFTICLWGETFGSRTILLISTELFLVKQNRFGFYVRGQILNLFFLEYSQNLTSCKLAVMSYSKDTVYHSDKV